MSQSDPVPAKPQNGAASSKPTINEEVLFDGSPSWVGRFRAFLFTWLLALLLIAIPIILKITATGFPGWIIAVGVLLALVLVFFQRAYHATIRYRITSYRVDYERGLLTRRIDSLELWHAEDLFFRQSLTERMMGVGNIDIIAKDRSTPRFELKAIPDARNVFEKLKSAILAAKRQRGLLEVDQ